jgi:hypothetical protein
METTQNTSNIFGFDYQIEKLFNRDDENSPSRFAIVYGQNGKIIHSKKDSYTIVPTSDVSRLADAFNEKGYPSKPFIHRNGEIIGLNVQLLENKKTTIGDKSYSLFINIANNGNGVGEAKLFEERLICTNGAVRKNVAARITIPHLSTYSFYLNQVQKMVDIFPSLVEAIENEDQEKNDFTLSKDEFMKVLNHWFFLVEFPVSQKLNDNWTLDKFRKSLALNPDSIPCIDRYNELIKSRDEEFGFNVELNLNLSLYTAYAVVTNYLSKRLKKSQSSAPAEVKQQRDAEKLSFFSKENLERILAV